MDAYLSGGAYQARSGIASAQVCINLYPEINPQYAQAPTPLTHYVTPGLHLLIAGQQPQPVRCTYTASNGVLYECVGNSIYLIDSTFGSTLIGIIGFNSTQVSMSDNGLAILIVDGSANGFCIDMATNTFGRISATNFYGATAVDFLDTFFILNRPHTDQFYISLGNVTFAMLTGGTAFDALDIAAKNGYPDNIESLIVIQGYIWLIGKVTAEIWYNSGAADFTFQRLPGVNVIQRGTNAPYSLVGQDLFPYFISRDKKGNNIIVKGINYQLKRISTHAIEKIISKYTVSQCVSYCYQQEGHTFIVFNFPEGTWVYDEASELWHQRCYTDNNGNLQRSRTNCIANAYDKIVGGDYLNGNLYEISLESFTDNGQPISRIRAWPLINKEAKRNSVGQAIADMDTGEDDGSTDGSTSSNPPVAYLRWSDDRGKTWSNKIPQSLGSVGEYANCMQWQRTGIARYRVFELSWSAPCFTAVNSLFITDQTSAT